MGRKIRSLVLLLSSENFKIIRYVIFLFLGWRIALFFVTFLGLGFFANTDAIHKVYFAPQINLDYWSRWANWDGGHYMGIAANGYLPIQSVFFPGYPILIKLFSFSGLSIFWSSFFISQIATIISLFFLYKLTLLDFSEEIAKKVIYIFLIFPTSFYLGSSYSDSLFLAITLSAFFYARKQNWVIAAFLAGLASITRLIGLVVVALVIFEYLFTVKEKFEFKLFLEKRLLRFILLSLVSYFILIFLKNISNFYQLWVFSGLIIFINQILIIIIVALIVILICEWVLNHLSIKHLQNIKILIFSLGIIPFLFFLWFQKNTFGSLFSFIQTESNWQKALSYPWQGPLDNLVKLQNYGFFQLGDQSRILFQFCIFILLIAGLIFSLKKLYWLYTLYYALALLIPLMSGTLLDLPRYTLAIFPFFMVLGLMKNDLLEKSWIFLSLFLQAALAILFINSYWFM